MTRDSLIRHLPIRDVEDAGEMLGVSGRTVRRLAAKGALVSHRVGNSLRFSEADIADFIRRSRSDAVT
jgi:excisionase family DNA binding protein